MMANIAAAAMTEGRSAAVIGNQTAWNNRKMRGLAFCPSFARLERTWGSGWAGRAPSRGLIYGAERHQFAE